jgi:hypothetical protein
VERVRLKLGVLGVVGMLAPLWWTWAVSQLTYAVYVASGSPKHASQALLWTSIYAPAFVLGLLTGAVVAVLGAPTPLKGWFTFFGSLVLGSIVLGIYFGEPAEYLAALFSSPGSWFFFVGSVLWPAVAYARTRAAPVPDPDSVQ